MSQMSQQMAAVALQLQQRDAVKASNLRKTAHLQPRKPGTGPRIAR